MVHSCCRWFRPRMLLYASEGTGIILVIQIGSYRYGVNAGLLERLLDLLFIITFTMYVLVCCVFEGMI